MTTDMKPRKKIPVFLVVRVVSVCCGITMTTDMMPRKKIPVFLVVRVVSVCCGITMTTDMKPRKKMYNHDYRHEAKEKNTCVSCG